MTDDSGAADMLAATHDAVASGDVGAFLTSAAFLTTVDNSGDMRRYIERATGYVMAQAQAEENPTSYRVAVLDGHAALYRDAYEALVPFDADADGDEPIAST